MNLDNQPSGFDRRIGLSPSLSLFGRFRVEDKNSAQIAVPHKRAGRERLSFINHSADISEVFELNFPRLDCHQASRQHRGRIASSVQAWAENPLKARNAPGIAINNHSTQARRLPGA